MFFPFSVPIELEQQDVSFARVRFLCYRKSTVYATDLGLGLYHAVSLTDGHVETVRSKQNGTNRLKKAAGVDTDPAGSRDRLFTRTSKL